MATIAFLMLPEKGHINSSLKIAKTLKSRGHNVYYLQLPDFDEYISSQGLGFMPLFENIFPKGRDFHPYLSTIENLFSRLELIGASFRTTGLALLIKELRSKLKRIGAHLLVQDINTEINPGLLETGIPCVVLNPTLVPRSVYTVPEVPVLTLCPKEFDLPDTKSGSRQHHVEAAIDLERRERVFPWDLVDGDRTLIYCSLGTQSHWSLDGVGRESKRSTRKDFLQTVIKAVAERPDWQLILSMGNRLSSGDFHPAPSNVLLFDAVPQIEVLKRASLMITHGGLNSVKECILLGVPMVVFPLAVDQFKNADCVSHHRLGLKGSIENVSEGLIRSLIDEVDGNPLFRRGIETMRDIFIRAEGLGPAITIIEEALKSGPTIYSPESARFVQ